MAPLLRNLLGRRALPRMLIFLFLSAVYLYAFPQPNVFYAVIVLLHAIVGTVASAYLVLFLVGVFRSSSFAARLGWLLVLGSAVIGLLLNKLGTSRPEWNWLYLHIALALAGCGILFADWAGRNGWLPVGFVGAASRYGICFLALAGLSASAWYTRNSRWLTHARIQNPADAPATMNEEG